MGWGPGKLHGGGSRRSGKLWVQALGNCRGEEGRRVWGEVMGRGGEEEGGEEGVWGGRLWGRRGEEDAGGRE